MFIDVAVIVFLFLAIVRLSKSKSIAEVIRSRYSLGIVKRIWKLKKLDYRLRKAELNLQFLCKCDGSNAMHHYHHLANIIKALNKIFSRKNLQL